MSDSSWRFTVRGHRKIGPVSFEVRRSASLVRITSQCSHFFGEKRSACLVGRLVAVKDCKGARLVGQRGYLEIVNNLE